MAASVLPPRIITPISRVSFLSLTVVALRKTADTRSGKALLGLTALLIIGLNGVWFYQQDSAYTKYLNAMRDSGGEMPHPGESGIDLPVYLANVISQPAGFMSLILAVVGIMSITTDWSHKSVMTTFILEPRRWRNSAAGVLAALLLSIVFSALTLLSSSATLAIFVATHETTSARWGTWWTYTSLVLFNLSLMSIGVAIGTLAQNTAAGISAFLFLPMIVATLSAIPNETVQNMVLWSSPLGNTTNLLQDTVISGKSLQKLLSTLAIWVAIPYLLGLWRMIRREVKSS